MRKQQAYTENGPIRLYPGLHHPGHKRLQIRAKLRSVGDLSSKFAKDSSRCIPCQRCFASKIRDHSKEETVFRPGILPQEPRVAKTTIDKVGYLVSDRGKNDGEDRHDSMHCEKHVVCAPYTAARDLQTETLCRRLAYVAQ